MPKDTPNAATPVQASSAAQADATVAPETATRSSGARQGIAFGVGGSLGYAIASGTGPGLAVRLDVEWALSSKLFLLFDLAPSAFVTSHSSLEGVTPTRTDNLTTSALLLRAQLGYDIVPAFSVRLGPVLGVATTSVDSACGATKVTGAAYGAGVAPAFRFGSTKRWEVALLGDVLMLPDARCTGSYTSSSSSASEYESGNDTDLYGVVSVGMSYTWR